MTDYKKQGFDSARYVNMYSIKLYLDMLSHFYENKLARDLKFNAPYKPRKSAASRKIAASTLPLLQLVLTVSLGETFSVSLPWANNYFPLTVYLKALVLKDKINDLDIMWQEFFFMNTRQCALITSIVNVPMFEIALVHSIRNLIILSMRISADFLVGELLDSYESIKKST